MGVYEMPVFERGAVVVVRVIWVCGGRRLGVWRERMVSRGVGAGVVQMVWCTQDERGCDNLLCEMDTRERETIQVICTLCSLPES